MSQTGQEAYRRDQGNYCPRAPHRGSPRCLGDYPNCRKPHFPTSLAKLSSPLYSQPSLWLQSLCVLCMGRGCTPFIPALTDLSRSFHLTSSSCHQVVTFFMAHLNVTSHPFPFQEEEEGGLLSVLSYYYPISVKTQNSQSQRGEGQPPPSPASEAPNWPSGRQKRQELLFWQDNQLHLWRPGSGPSKV